MKKNIPLLIISLTLFFISKAQDNAFNKGDNLLNAGIGLGGAFSGFGSSIPVSVSYERGITNEFGIGAQASYASAKSYGVKVSATFLGARGTYHLCELLNLPSKFDVYGGAVLGYVIVSASDGQDSATGSEFGYAFFAGGKYFFSSHTGVFAELGLQSLGNLNIGVSFKF